MFPSCLFYSLITCEGHLFNLEYNKNNNFRIFSKCRYLYRPKYRGIGIGHKLSSYWYQYRYWPSFWYRYITNLITAYPACHCFIANYVCLFFSILQFFNGRLQLLICCRRRKMCLHWSTELSAKCWAIFPSQTPSRVHREAPTYPRQKRKGSSNVNIFFVWSDAATLQILNLFRDLHLLAVLYYIFMKILIVNSFFRCIGS